MGFFDFVESVVDTVKENVGAAPGFSVGAVASTMSGAEIMAALATIGFGSAAVGVAVVGVGCYAAGKQLDKLTSD